MKSDKTTVSKKNPETVIETDLHMTFIMDYQMSKKEAEEMIHYILKDWYDNLQIKDIKVFQNEGGIKTK
jgi:hypothetical protein